MTEGSGPDLQTIREDAESPDWQWSDDATLVRNGIVIAQFYDDGHTPGTSVAFARQAARMRRDQRTLLAAVDRLTAERHDYEDRYETAHANYMHCLDIYNAATRDRDRFARTIEYRVKELDEARRELAGLRAAISRVEARCVEAEHDAEHGGRDFSGRPFPAWVSVDDLRAALAGSVAPEDVEPDCAECGVGAQTRNCQHNCSPVGRRRLAQIDADYQSGRWCGECRWGVVENPPCCFTEPVGATPTEPPTPDCTDTRCREFLPGPHDRGEFGCMVGPTEPATCEHGETRPHPGMCSMSHHVNMPCSQPCPGPGALIEDGKQ